MRAQNPIIKKIIAYKNLEPLFGHPHHRTEQILEKAAINKHGNLNTSLILEIKHQGLVPNPQGKYKHFINNQFKVKRNTLKEKMDHSYKNYSEPHFIAESQEYAQQQKKRHLTVAHEVNIIENEVQTQAKGSNQHKNAKNLQVQSKEIILKNIEMLKSSQSHFLSLIEAEQREDNHINLQDEQRSQNADENGKSFQLSRQYLTKIKEKIKMKQSRRNIYHILKNKNENWNKIKIKNRHQRKETNSIDINQIQLLRLHCCHQDNKKSPPNIRQNNFRSLAKTYYSNLQEIRSQQKNKSIDSTKPLELRSTKCQYLISHALDIEDDTKYLRSNKKKGIEVYEEIISKLKKRQNNQQSNHLPSKKPQTKNIFRELTPWHLDQS